MSDIKSLVHQFILASPTKVSFTHLKHHFCGHRQVKQRMLKSVVSSLILNGQLRYTYHFGNTFIEPSFDRPRLVSDHVILTPPTTNCQADPGQQVITLEKGASFGGGEHPTTRMAIQLADMMLHQGSWRFRKADAKALDIGTGSGVLAIVAAKLGIGRVDAIDTDPCARFEARANIRLNRLQGQVRVFDGSLGTVVDRYELILANLRTPTLINFYSQLETRLADNCLLLFSGMKADEIRTVRDFYEKAGFSGRNERVKNSWGALCLARGVFRAESPAPRVGY
jgi:ribosomal protein L11 methyltransferase